MSEVEFLLDVSRARAAKIVGHSAAYMRRHWDEIPTAYTEGKRSYVSLAGLRTWATERGKRQEERAS